MDPATLARPLKVFLVEDSVLVRARLAVMLEAIEGVSIVGEADEPVSALAGIAGCDVDVVVIDLHLLAGTSGLTVLRGLPEHDPDIVPVVLTNSPQPQYRDTCLAAGAHFFLDKTSEIGLLHEVIRRMVQDNRRRPVS